MKALSVRQPDAWLLANGVKDVENRTWATGVRGWVAVHASSAKMNKDDRAYLAEVCEAESIPVPNESELARGAIVGFVRIADCVTVNESPWFSGPFGFTVDASISLVPAEHVHCKGALGFWEFATALDPAAFLADDPDNRGEYANQLESMHNHRDN